MDHIVDILLKKKRLGVIMHKKGGGGAPDKLLGILTHLSHTF